MSAKVLLHIIDGLGDRPVSEFGGFTPLEAAATPHLDDLARGGATGHLSTLGIGLVPGSDAAHLTIFGYGAEAPAIGRGVLEVAGVGAQMAHGDIALRGNFATVADGGVIVDRRAGRIRDVRPLAEALDGITVEGVRFHVTAGTGHRAGVVLKGEGLSDRITNSDPHAVGEPVMTVRARDESSSAAFTARIVNAFSGIASDRLRDEPVNKDREAQGLPPANYLLLRGAGRYERVEPFQERFGLRACAIAGAGLYRGIGAYLGMDVITVPGANGLPDSDLEAKLRAAAEATERYDFVFVHAKAADSLGEDGNHVGKRDYLARLDGAEAALAGLDAVLILVTGDHSTPCAMKRHSADPVPLLIHGPGVRVDDVTSFGERACAKGILGRLEGREVMPEVRNLIGTAPLVGA